MLGQYQIFYQMSVADGFVWSIKGSLAFETIAEKLHRW